MKNPYESPAAIEPVERKKVCWTRSQQFGLAMGIGSFGLFLVTAGHSMYVQTVQKPDVWFAPIVLIVDFAGYISILAAIVLCMSAAVFSR